MMIFSSHLWTHSKTIFISCHESFMMTSPNVIWFGIWIYSLVISAMFNPRLKLDTYVISKYIDFANAKTVKTFHARVGNFPDFLDSGKPGKTGNEDFSRGILVFSRHVVNCSLTD